MATKLSIVENQNPPEALIQKALDRMMQGTAAQFAIHLEDARYMWQHFRELVEQPEFPQQFVPAYVAEFKDHPESGAAGIDGIEVFDPEYRDSLRPRAMEIARHWIDTDRVRKLGISN